MSERNQVDALVEAKAIIARQAAEIAQLRRRMIESDEGQLRQALALAASAGEVGAPVSHGRLLEMIVETAAAVIGAAAGALFLIDEAANELVFEVAIGPKAAEARRFRVPLGHGIAGLVAVSGQPMAVADAAQDARQASDIAEATGYIPKSILCVPLIYGERVVGVLELLDKIGAPSFGAHDLDTLALFANQAAVAIEQSRARGHLGSLLTDLLRSDDGQRAMQSRAEAFAARLDSEDTDFREALNLARLVNQIVWQGDEERRLCRSLLQSFADYLTRRSDVFGDLGALL
jgi:GAF domain-containing protein